MRADHAIFASLEAEGDKYTIRLPARSVLPGRIGWRRKTPAGRPPNAVRLHLRARAHHRASFLRTPTLPAAVSHGEQIAGRMANSAITGPRALIVAANRAYPSPKMPAWAGHMGKVGEDSSRHLAFPKLRARKVTKCAS